MLRLRLILVLGLFPLLTSGQDLVIKGVASQFSGEKLLLMKQVNPFTEQYVTTDTICITTDGKFRLETSISSSGWYFINMGIFNTKVFLVPGAEYTVELPPKIMKTEADIKNPFFTPVRAHLKILRELHPVQGSPGKIPYELNRLIYEFDTTVFASNEKLLEARSAGKAYNSDSLLQTLEDQFTNDTSSYFRKYRKYRYGLIKINSHDVGLEYLMHNFLGESAFDVNDLACWELFSKMYDKFLFYFSQTGEGRNINSIINRRHSISMLLDTLQKHPAIPEKSFAELVVLKEFSDNYYKDYYYRDAILFMLDSLTFTASTDINAAYSGQLKQKLTRLQIGTEPPAFNLPDIHNSMSTLEDFRGKYVYLIFCTTNDYTCLVEFPFLKALNAVHNKHLAIVNIMVSENMKKVQDFVSEYNYDWTFLYFDQNEELLEAYDVKAFPTCYLLDKEGKLVQSPATLATEGFEAQLFRIMRSRGDL